MKKFLRCEHCGNMVGVLNDSGVPMICCGEPMKELVPNTTDAANEKHVPVVTVEGDHRRALKPGEKPEAEFNLHGEKPVAVYEYCNLHGLWKKEL